jgi:Putative Ig domain/IPT/TIG domain
MKKTLLYSLFVLVFISGCGANSAPAPIAVTLSSGATQALDQGQSVTITATVANDSTSKGVTWSLASGPGAIASQTTTAVTYNANGASGSAVITATSVTDITKTFTVTITVTAVPAITTTTLPAGVEGTAYSQAIAKTGGAGTVTFSISAGTLPAGLTLSGAGTISGTPTGPNGTANFTVKVTDSSSMTPMTAIQALSILVNLRPAPAITTTTLPAGVEGTAYSQMVAATGFGALTFTTSAGALPAGLALSSAGLISGTPTVPNVTSNFTVMVTDSSNPPQTATQPLSILINPPPPPAITSLSQNAGPVGASITITGTNFGTPQGSSTVTFNGIAAAAASAWSTTSITVTVPVGATTGNVIVTVLGTASNGSPFTVAPTITTLSQTSGAVGVSITITGTNFGSPQGSSTVTFNGTAAAAASAWSTTSITVAVPAGATTGNVVVTVGGQVSNGSPFTIVLPPSITSLSQTSGPAGTSITITGTNFGATQGTSTVTFNGIAAAAASAWSATSITLSVPAGATTGNVVVTVFGTASNGSAFTVTASCTTNCSLSGTVTGPWVSGVTISLTGTASASTTTATNGTYSFASLAAGSYTITPTLAGYTYTPAPPTIAISSNTVQNFVEMPVIASYSISGTVTYSGSHTTGTTFIRVVQSGCTGGCNTVVETSIPTVPSSTGTPYTVRGLQATGTGGGPSGYVVTAEIDTLGTGQPNVSNPVGSSTTVTVPSSNVPNVNFTVSDRTPPLPVAPCSTTGNVLSIAPQSTVAVAQCKPPQDSNGEEVATSYRIYSATNSSFTGATFQTFPAHGTHDNVFIVSSLTNAPNYFFKMTALVGTTESGPSNVVGPVTIGPSSSGSTVSGNVTFPGTVPSNVPLYAGVYGNNGIYVVRILGPVSSQSYSVPGVPNGTYNNFAILDVNNNGVIDFGDITNTSNNSNPPLITVNNGPVTGNIILTNPVTTLNVTTNHQQTNGTQDTYGLNFGVSWGSKRPVAITLFSGPNVSVPFDMSVDQNNGGGQGPAFLNGAVPAVADTYQFLVTFSDGSTLTIPSSVTAVLNSFVTGMAMNSPVAGTATVPVLNWVTPTSTPSPYTYYVGLYNTTGSTNIFWNDNGGKNSNGIPSGTTNLLFNADGSANSNGTPITSLPTATTYNWFVTVQDANGNSSQESATYVIP